MWRRTALIVALGLTLVSRSKLVGQEHSCPDLLLSDLNWVRFDVMMGRMVAVTNRAKQDRQQARRELPDGTSESLVVSIDRGLTSLRYLRDNPTEQIAISVVRRDAVQIQWTWQQPAEQRTTMTYGQSPDADVQVTVVADGSPEQSFQAPSLWHLLAVEPQVRELPILGLLQSLRTDWRPADEATAIVQALVTTSPWQWTVSGAEVQKLVDQLGHKNFRIRQLADRELRSRGRPVLCLLDQLDFTQLDSEQRLRIREIQRAVRGNCSDTPDRVAAWLVNDQRVWLALMTHDDLRHRQVALAQLARIVDRPVDFDPQAARTTRTQQLAVLRSQLTLR